MGLFHIPGAAGTAGSILPPYDIKYIPKKTAIACYPARNINNKGGAPMLSFFFSLEIIGVVALFYALKLPHKAPFLGAHKTRANVLLRYGGFCVVCLLLALALPVIGVSDSALDNASRRAAPPAQTAAASQPTAEEQQKQAKKDAAFLTCRKLINGQVKDPHSVDVSVAGVVTSLRENGQVFVVIPFAAKNSFGQPRNMEATCHIRDGHDPQIALRER